MSGGMLGADLCVGEAMCTGGWVDMGCTRVVYRGGARKRGEQGPWVGVLQRGGVQRTE